MVSRPGQSPKTKETAMTINRSRQSATLLTLTSIVALSVFTLGTSDANAELFKRAKARKATRQAEPRNLGSLPTRDTYTGYDRRQIGYRTNGMWNYPPRGGYTPPRSIPQPPPTISYPRSRNPYAAGPTTNVGRIQIRTRPTYVPQSRPRPSYTPARPLYGGLMDTGSASPYVFPSN